MADATYRDGVATIITPSRKIQINVELTARLALQGQLGSARMSDMRALAAGFLALQAESAKLREELAAARAGQIGREWAEQMQGARAVIANLRRETEEFLEVYDRGVAPDAERDNALRAAANEAESWLVCDVHACAVRAKILKEKP